MKLRAECLKKSLDFSYTILDSLPVGIVRGVIIDMLRPASIRRMPFHPFRRHL
jgi:hypothetical protein